MVRPGFVVYHRRDRETGKLQLEYDWVIAVSTREYGEDQLEQLAALGR